MNVFADAAAVAMGWDEVALRLLGVAVLVAINGYFVAAEFAFVALRRTQVEELVKQNVSGAKSVEEAVDNLDRSIAAAQLGITLASILLGYVAEQALVAVVEPMFAGLPPALALLSAHTLAVILAITLITFLHVILGEQIPKIIAIQSADRVALWVAGPLNLFARLTRPFVSLMMRGSNWLVLRLGYQPVTGEDAIHSLEELQLIIEDQEEAGTLDADQADYVVNVFQLANKKVRDCMIPREKTAMLELGMSSEKILEAVRQGAHTRMPVYDKDPDKIVGIVNTKNLFFLFSLQGVVVLEDALYPATFLDPEESLTNALKLFRKSRRPMAMVRDESGKIHGLLTLEDVLEEIVGDIEDEHDRPIPKVKLKRKRPVSGFVPVRPPGPPPRPGG